MLWSYVILDDVLDHITTAHTKRHVSEDVIRTDETGTTVQCYKKRRQAVEELRDLCP